MRRHTGPQRRRQDTDEQVIARDVFRRRLLPAVPDRYRGLVAVAGGAGLRWGEAAGLYADAVDLDASRLRVIRTVVEVAGHTQFKGYPKSTAGRRTIPLPGWLVEILRAHVELYGYGEADLLFANGVGGTHRRTLFRARQWRPSLVRAGLLGSLTQNATQWVGTWTDVDASDIRSDARPKTSPSVRSPDSRPADCAITTYGTRSDLAGRRWVPPNMVQRLMGHERASTTLDLYTRRTDDAYRILRALDDAD